MNIVGVGGSAGPPVRRAAYRLRATARVLAAIEEFDRPPSIGTEVDNSEDYFQAILAGHGVAMLTESSAQAYQRPGIEYRLVEDAIPGELAVVWPSGRTDPLLRDFVGACTDAADRKPQRITGPDPGTWTGC